MIKPLSKVQIVGPADLLYDTISFLKNEKVIHPEKEIESFCSEAKEHLRNCSISEEAVKERIYLESLKKKIEEFISLAGNFNFSEKPDYLVDIKNLPLEIDGDLKNLKELKKHLEENQTKLKDFKLYALFYSLTEEIVGGEKEPHLLEIIGLVLKSEEATRKLHQILEDKTGGIYRLITKKLESGEIVAIIFSSKDVDINLKKELKELNIPELATPPALAALPLSEKVHMVNEKIAVLTQEEAKIKNAISDLVKNKKGYYLRALEILDEKLSKLKDLIYVYKTDKIFSLFGWIQKDRLLELSEKLRARFDGYVILEEQTILEEDKERMPVIIVNPDYLKPFEVLTRILPIPAYKSYDPTPFLGIFFPLFFGIIVGDLGYGLIIIILSLIIRQAFKDRDFAVSISKVLGYAGTSALIFGIIYGEFFGDLGKRIGWNLIKIVDREHSILQLFIISIIIGIVHIFIGLILNVLKPAEKKERLISLSIMLNIFLLFSILYLFFTEGAGKTAQFLIFLLALVFVFSFITFGIIFPLELIKSLGNIVSYGRIMAIGLSSIILANVANSFLDITGNIFLGVFIALLFHLTNIVLSIFSPSIHSLRLHYVEFFSKFMKFGGRKFNPL